MKHKADINLLLREYLGKRLRAVYRYSPVKRAAKLLYKTCALCGVDEDIEIDHEPSIVPPDREIGSIEYFSRMFCLNENGEVDLTRLVGLCYACHKQKTAEHRAALAKNGFGPWSKRAMEKRRATLYRRRNGKKKKSRKKRKR